MTVRPLTGRRVISGVRDEHMAKFERQYLTELLRRHGGEVTSAAIEAQLPRGTLYRLLKNHGIDAGSFRG